MHRQGQSILRHLWRLTLIASRTGSGASVPVEPLSGICLACRFMIEPDSLLGERAKRLFRHAQELIRKHGIAILHGVQVNAGLITVHVTSWPPQSEESRVQYTAAGRKWFPYRLEIWQRKQVMLSVNYNYADEIEITTFRRGLWEGRLPTLGNWIESVPGSDQQKRPRKRGA
jgi:hypothetical protein